MRFKLLLSATPDQGDKGQLQVCKARPFALGSWPRLDPTKVRPCRRYHSQRGRAVIRDCPRLREGAGGSDPSPRKHATLADEPRVANSGGVCLQPAGAEHLLPAQGRQHATTAAAPPDEHWCDWPLGLIPGQRKVTDADRRRRPHIPALDQGWSAQVDPSKASWHPPPCPADPEGQGG